MCDMGLYDSIHTGKRCGQVKCLGKGTGNLVPGSVAVLYRSANEAALGEGPADLTVEASESFSAEDLAFTFGIPQTTPSWQIAMTDGYTRFVDGVFLSWETEPDPDLPIVASDGCTPKADGTSWRGASLDAADVEECGYCAALRDADQVPG